MSEPPLPPNVVDGSGLAAPAAARDPQTSILDDALLGFAVRSAASRSSLTVQEDACRTIAAALGVDAVGILERDPTRDALVMIAAVGWPMEALAAEDGVAGQVGDDDARVSPGCCFSSPIHVCGRRWGAISVITRAPRRLLETEIRAVEAIAKLVAAVLDREQAEARLPLTTSRFVSKLAHQVRQPLLGIGLEVALLRSSPSESRLRQAMDRIENETWRCDRLLRRAVRLAGDPGQLAPRSADADVDVTLDDPTDDSPANLLGHPVVARRSNGSA